MFKGFWILIHTKLNQAGFRCIAYKQRLMAFLIIN